MLVNAYFLQGSFLSVSKSLFNDLTLQQPRGCRRHYYCQHFTNEEADLQREVKWPAQTRMAHK